MNEVSQVSYSNIHDPWAPIPSLVKLSKINTHAATPASKSLENIKFNITRSLPRLHHLSDFKKLKKDTPIALVGGGPSVKDHLEELRRFPGPVVACGSVHDYLVAHDVRSYYCILVDPDPITTNYITTPTVYTRYLVASQCDASVFERLKNLDIVLWHCYADNVQEARNYEPDFQGVGGGCTVGLRAICIAIMLGYSNIHFFGFDSCLGVGDQHHAYGFTSGEEIGDVYHIKLGMDDKVNVAKEYRCAGYHVAQANHFVDFYAEYNGLFTPTFHGEGMLPELYSMIRHRAKELEKQGDK